MPNVALLFGAAGLLGALFAGLYFLYNEDVNYNNFHAYENEPRTSNRYRDGHDYSDRNGFRPRTLNRTRRRREEENDDDTCTVCCDAIEFSEKLSTNCGHSFHIKCIGKWLTSQSREPYKTCASCPVCRSTITAREYARILELTKVSSTSASA